ncbi:MAG TPA: hypothetical protein PLV70_08410 [Flavobacteriales bacterium]|nr:hypothetical protein [Flavobacteriales bacterium]HRQ85117.1 hypothetical protein [Flavobacteriales bacterium]
MIGGQVIYQVFFPAYLSSNPAPMRGLLLIAAVLATVGAKPQGVLFRNYGEYEAKAGEPVAGLITVEPHWGRFMVACEKEGRTVRIPTRRIWGFLNKGMLYRIEQEGRLPVRLMSQGAIWYWENGFAHLRMQKDSAEAAGFEYGHAAYLSHDLKGTIVPAAFAVDDTRSASAKFKAAWPAYKDLLESIGDGTDMDRVRQLVVEYEVAVEEGRAPGP